MSVNPSALAPLVTRLNNTHAKVKGSPLPLPSSSDLDSLVSSLELLAASLSGANPTDLAKLTTRLEAALAKIGAKVPPASGPLNSVETVTSRLEQLAAAATGVSAHNGANATQNKPVAAHTSAPAPSAAPSAASTASAAAASAPKVDASKAKAEAEAKAKADAEAAKKKEEDEKKKIKEEAEKKAKASAQSAPASHVKPASAPAVSAAKPAVTATHTATPAPAASATPAATPAPSHSSSGSGGAATGPGASGPFYSLDQLKGPASAVPSGVNYPTRELWLNDADFVKALKVTKIEWAKLPGWKKEQAKKAVGLF